MSETGENLTPSLNFVECPDHSFQEITRMKSWDEETSSCIGEKQIVTAECGQCGNTGRVLEELTLPQTGLKLKVPKNWQLRFDKPSGNVINGLTASSLWELDKDPLQRKGAILNIRVTPKQIEDTSLSWEKIHLDKKVIVGDQTVTVYRQTNPEANSVDFAALFNYQNKGYKARMSLNSSVYPQETGEAIFGTVLRSFEFTT